MIYLYWFTNGHIYFVIRWLRYTQDFHRFCFFFKTAIVYACKSVDLAFLHVNLRVFFRASYMLFDKNKSKHEQYIIDVYNNKAIVTAF